MLLLSVRLSMSKHVVTHLKSLTLTSSWGMAVDLSSNRVERNGWEMRSPNSFIADIARGERGWSLKAGWDIRRG